MNKMSLVIMAAGIGSRYGGLKQMDAFGPGHELIIEYSIYDALRAGFNKVVFIIKKNIEKDFREIIGRRFENICEVAYVFQELDALPPGFQAPSERQKPWGTGHATLLCRNEVKGNFAVINADDFYGASSFASIYKYLLTANDSRNFYDYTMVGYLLKNTITNHGHVARGICSLDAKGYLSEIHERTYIKKFGNVIRFSENDGKSWTKLSPDSTVSMNLWGFTPSIFPELESYFEQFLAASIYQIKAEFFLPDVVGALLRAKKATVKVIPTLARWAGVTYQEDKASVKTYIESLVEAGVYPRKLWSEV